MSKIFESERLIVEEIRNGGGKTQVYINKLYADHFPKVRRFIQRNNGSENDAKDIFQEGMMILYKQIMKDKFRGESRIGTYLFSICRYLWYHQLEDRGKTGNFAPDLSELEKQNLIFPYQKILQKQQWRWIDKVFSQLADDCRKILLNALYYQYSMEEIALQMEFENAQIARNKKYKCLKRLRGYLDEHPELKSILRDIVNNPT
ncbi:MAG: sigma-70 family RNA polymerase sigma factor [Bacteroidia bacterium]